MTEQIKGRLLQLCDDVETVCGRDLADVRQLASQRLLFVVAMVEGFMQTLRSAGEYALEEYIWELSQTAPYLPRRGEEIVQALKLFKHLAQAC